MLSQSHNGMAKEKTNKVANGMTGGASLEPTENNGAPTRGTHKISA